MIDRFIVIVAVAFSMPHHPALKAQSPWRDPSFESMTPGSIELDVRGTTTVREQLEKHRTAESCAGCHRKIDPPGFALESFDVTGAWRDRYRSLEKGDAVPAVFVDRPVKYKLGPAVDATGQSEDGKPFRDIREFRALLLEDQQQLARNLTERLLVYATGAGISFADRAEVERIVTATTKTNHGLRSLIHEVVQSRLFTHKEHEHLHPPPSFPPPLPSRTRHHACVAAAGGHDAGICQKLRRPSAPDDRRDDEYGHPAAALLSAAARLRLREHALPRSVEGLSPADDRLQRPLASRGGWRTQCGHRLVHRSAAPAPPRLSQHHLARSICRRTHRPSHTISLAVPAGRSGGQAQPLLDPQRRDDPVGKKAGEVFKRLFIQGTPAEVQAQVARLRAGQSILDAVAGRAKNLERSLSGEDRAKLDQYFISVREAEQRLHKAEAWEHQPKPMVDAKPPVDIADPADLVGKSRLMYDMAALALQSDCTRLITIFIEEDHNPTVKVPGVTQGHHSLTHHGNKPEALDELSRIEEAQFGTFRELLMKLRAHREHDGSLLDSTAVLYGTNMGNANAHSNDNLPFLIAGCACKHTGHIAFDK